MSSMKIVMMALVALSVAVFASGGWAQEPSAAGPGAEPTATRILVLATRHVSQAKLRLLSEQATATGRFNVDYRYVSSIEEETPLRDVVAPYDIIIFDAISADETQEDYASFEPIVSGAQIFVPIKVLSSSPLRHGVTDEQAHRLYEYYYNGGAENLRRMLAYLAQDVLASSLDAGASVAPVAPPILFADTGIYRPDYEGVVFDELAAFADWRGGLERSAQPVIAVALSRESISAGDTGLADAVIAAIETRGGVAVPYYYPGSSELEQVRILQLGGETAVDVIINTRTIHWSARRREEFEALGVPVLQALPYRSGDQAEWEAFAGGLPAQSTPFYLTLPEIAGAADPIVVSARAEDGTQAAIDYQLELVIARAFNHAALARMANSDKRIALMFYNYPPGERSAGASFLNAPRSIDGILERLGEAGYVVEDRDEEWFIDRVGVMLRPYYRGEPLTELPGVGEHDGSAGLLPMSRYRAWYATLPSDIRTAIEAEWGAPETAFSVADVDGELQFIIPRILAGQVMILPQPPRGNRAEDEGAIFHDESVPVSHNYLAVYLFAREEFGADALIHLGTHGSQEWLPGKERGLSRYDAGNLAIGDIPVIYPFIMDDVGEAIQAKRRGRAIMISHLTPPMTQSGLYAELADMHDLMHQYGQLGVGAVRERTRAQIIEAVLERNLHQDTGWEAADIDARFDDFLIELHAWLGELGNEIQPLGLHTFGGLPETDHLTSTIVQMLGDGFAEHALEHGERYLTSADADAHDHDHDAHDHNADHDHSHELADPGEASLVSHEDFSRLKETTAYRLVDQFVFGDGDTAQIREADLRGDLERGQGYLASFRDIGEYDSLLDALSGRFIAPTTGGDPVRHPEALPSGGNLYGFDPSKMPTPAAWEAGRELTETMIAEYYDEHGVYPDKVTYSLWAIEAMRHLGVIESQAMAAMGVRPVWSEAGYVTGVEIIPYAELGRPRVDVVLSVSGLYRDALPNLIQLLAGAVDEVAALREDNNYVRLNSLRIRDELIADGMPAEDAERMSTLRVFSNETGTYGTGLAGASLASGQWEGDDRLAEMYLSRMGYAYGADDTVWSQDLRDVRLYARNLAGTDAAVFSRTSNLYGLLTSDDPFQYMGGISLAVRYLDGASPEMFISNLRDVDDMRMEPLDRFLARELRTRQFHPQWIEAMQEEGYAGTLTMLDSINNFWGWQVVDPQSVRDDQWQEFFEVYVQDEQGLDMREWFEEANPHALAQMVERMLEAVRKDYWDADDATVVELMATYIELANAFDVVSSNRAFLDYVGEGAVGYGLEPLTGPPSASVAAPAAEPRVQGQVLEQVSAAPDQEFDLNLLLLGLVIFVPFLLGAVAQLGSRSGAVPRA